MAGDFIKLLAVGAYNGSTEWCFWIAPWDFTACWVGGSLSLTEDLRMFIALVASANCRFIGWPLLPSLEGSLRC